MNTNDIIAEARNRLAELEAEREKLLRMMIAAAEGATPAAPMPTIPMWPACPAWPVWPIYPGDGYPSPFIWTTWGSSERSTTASRTHHAPWKIFQRRSRMVMRAYRYGRPPRSVAEQADGVLLIALTHLSMQMRASFPIACHDLRLRFDERHRGPSWGLQPCRRKGSLSVGEHQRSGVLAGAP